MNMTNFFQPRTTLLLSTLSITIFLGSIGLGTVYSLQTKGHFPGITFNHLSDADQQFATGQYEAAGVGYRIASTIAPDDDKAIVKFGLASYYSAQPEQAIEAWKQGLSINPYQAEAHYLLGLAYLDKGELNKAVGHNLQAIKYRTNFTEAYHNLGTAYARMGKSREAIQSFQKALTINPEFAPSLNNLNDLQAQP